MKKLSGLLLPIVLAGCNASHTLTADTPLPENDGVVVSQLTQNTSFASMYFANWQALTMENIETNEPYIIGQSQDGYSRSTFYIGNVPEGEYRLVKLSSTTSGGYTITSQAPISDKLGTFTIESGKITNLGHLLFDRVGQSVVTTQGPLSDQRFSDYLNVYRPNLGEINQPDRFLGWDENSSATNVYSAYEHIQRYTQGLNNATSLPSGDLLFAGFINSVRHWRVGEGLTSYVVDDVKGSIESVIAVNASTWLAGSEYGSLHLTQDGGKSWMTFGDGFPGFSITHMSINDEQLYAVIANLDTIKVVTTPLNNIAWQQLGSWPSKFSKWSGGLMYPVTKKVDNTLFLALPGGDMLAVDMTNQSITQLATPGTIMEFTADVRGHLHVKAASSIIVNPYVSVDQGQTWQSAPQDRMMTLPYYIDENTGFGVQTGVIDQTLLLKQTQDGGTTWNDVTELPYRTLGIGYIGEKNALYLTNYEGLLLESYDSGKTWQPVKNLPQ